MQIIRLPPCNMSQILQVRGIYDLKYLDHELGMIYLTIYLMIYLINLICPTREIMPTI